MSCLRAILGGLACLAAAAHAQVCPSIDFLTLRSIRMVERSKAGSKPLEAGPITVNGRAVAARGEGYFEVLGGRMPLSSSGELPLFFRRAPVEFEGAGGAAVPPFRHAATLPAAIEWTNRRQTRQIERSAGVVIHWKTEDRQPVLIVGAQFDRPVLAAAGFACRALPGTNQMRIPARLLQ